MKSLMNYTNDGNRALRKGRISDVVKLRKRLFTRIPHRDVAETTTELSVDLVQILTDLGIILSNTHTIARLLVSRGWRKIKQIEKDRA